MIDVAGGAEDEVHCLVVVRRAHGDRSIRGSEFIVLNAERIYRELAVVERMMLRCCVIARAWCDVACEDGIGSESTWALAACVSGNSIFETLMATIVAIAPFARVDSVAGIDRPGLAVISHSRLASAFCLLLAFATARVFGPTIRRGGWLRVVWGLAILSLLAAMYVDWAHYRAMNQDSLRLDGGFPYPDAAINALEQWLDARRPVPPGTLELHGEYPTVGFILGMSVLGFTTLIGMFAGLLSRAMESATQCDWRRPEAGEPRIQG